MMHQPLSITRQKTKWLTNPDLKKAPIRPLSINTLHDDTVTATLIIGSKSTLHTTLGLREQCHVRKRFAASNITLSVTLVVSTYMQNLNNDERSACYTLRTHSRISGLGFCRNYNLINLEQCMHTTVIHALSCCQQSWPRGRSATPLQVSVSQACTCVHNDSPNMCMCTHVRHVSDAILENSTS